MPSFSVSERAALCDTALSVGPDAPTLCGHWRVEDLLAHLAVREGNLLAAPGIVLPPLSFLTDAAMKRATKRGFDTLVEAVRRPPVWSPFRIPAVDRIGNTLELYIHHEDIRRAGPVWEPRALSDREQGALWTALGTAGKGLVRPAGVPVTIGCTLNGTHRTRTLRAGADPVTVTGPPSELAMFLFGRHQHQGLVFGGPEDSMEKLRGAKLGI